MVKFGILKSKIEKLMLESYSKNTFKEEMKTFKKLVLESKNISKLFYLYNELNSNKGLNESVVDDYINECVTVYENVINKVTTKDLVKLTEWVKNVKCENEYSNIDNLFSNDVLTIESRILGKKQLKESLKRKPSSKKEIVNLPLSAMVNVANKTITNFIENLNESEKNELISYLKSDDKELEVKFNDLRESVKSKLSVMKEQSEDFQTKTRIDETLEKVQSAKYDKFTYFKLKNLNDNL
jgi:hypothetical protein